MLWLLELVGLALSLKLIIHYFQIFLHFRTSTTQSLQKNCILYFGYHFYCLCYFRRCRSSRSYGTLRGRSEDGGDHQAVPHAIAHGGRPGRYQRGARQHEPGRLAVALLRYGQGVYTVANEREWEKKRKSEKFYYWNSQKMTIKRLEFSQFPDSCENGPPCQLLWLQSRLEKLNSVLFKGLVIYIKKIRQIQVF